MAALPFVFSCFFLFLQRSFDLGRFFVLHFLYFLFDRVTESHPPALSEVIACPGSHTFFAFISEQHHFFFSVGQGSFWVGFLFLFSKLFRYLDTLRLGFVFHGTFWFTYYLGLCSFSVVSRQVTWHRFAGLAYTYQSSIIINQSIKGRDFLFFFCLLLWRSTMDWVWLRIVSYQVVVSDLVNMTWQSARQLCCLSCLGHLTN